MTCGTGAKSAYTNFRQGKIGAGIVDVVGVGIDAAAVALPFAPGGATTIIQVGRAADKAHDALKTAGHAKDAVTKGGQSARQASKETKEQVQREFRGGAYGDMKKPVGDGLEAHHMPAKSVSPVPAEKGMAVQMENVDHRATSSYGSGKDADAYREQVADLISQGRMRDAMAKEVKDVRNVAEKASGTRTKYNQALKEALDYGKRGDTFHPSHQDK